MLPLAELRLVGIALAVAALLGGFAWFTHYERELGAAREQAAATAQALAGERAARAESDRRVVAVQLEANHADLAASAARADADAAHSAGDRLRLRLLAAERGRAASDSAASGPGPTADAPGMVPYDVFEGVRAAGERLAAFADQSRIAGLACERSYDALSPSAGTSDGHGR